MTFSYKTKHTVTLQSSIHASWYLIKETQNLRPYKNVHMDVHSSFIQKCQKLGSTKMYFIRYMDKPLIHITMEYYIALTGNELSYLKKTWRSLKCILLNESESEKVKH